MKAKRRRGYSTAIPIEIIPNLREQHSKEVEREDGNGQEKIQGTTSWLAGWLTGWPGAIQFTLGKIFYKTR